MSESSAPAYRVVIPARFGSTRLPGKALADIAGKPLIEWVWRSASRSAAQQIVVATDDDRIARACESVGADVCLTRSDHQSGTDRIAEVVETKAWPDDTVVVNLQGDEPDTAPENLDAVARCLVAHPEAVMATLSVPLRDPEEFVDPACVKVVSDRKGYALYFSRASVPFVQHGDGHCVPDCAARHLGIYAYRAGFLRQYATLVPAPIESIESLEQLRVMWHGERIAVAEAPTRPGPGVDTPADLERVRQAFERGQPDV